MNGIDKAIRKPLASLVLAGGLTAASVMGAAAAPANAQQGGAAGLVAAVVQVADTLNQNQVGLVNVGNSLNNLTALNNVLDNSPILNQNNVTVSRVVTIGNISALNLTDVQVTALNDVLNNNHIPIDSVVGVGVLSGGQLVVFQR